MEIFGIGPLEILFILLLALIIFGPKDLHKTGLTIGRSLNKLVRSEGWKVFTNTTKQIRTLPNTLMREANLEDRDQSEAKGEMPAEARIAPPVDPAARYLGEPDVIIGEGSDNEATRVE